MEDKYIGTAMAYPLQLKNGRGVVQTEGKLVIEEAIANLLNTPKGSRFMLGDYGSRLEEVLFEQNDEVLYSMLRLFIYEAIRDWEKRVRFEDVEFERVSTDRVNCMITYKVLKSNEINSFVYPFYQQLIY